MSTTVESARIRKAVILAAGRGTRLGSLTADRPKPMIPVRGRPVLQHIVAGLRAAGVDRFLMVVGYRADAVGDYFAGDPSIEYADQNPPTGTGAALALAEGFAAGRPIIMSFGDVLTDPGHYAALIEDYQESPCAAVMGINPIDDPSAGAAVYLDGRSIVRVVEKPPPGTSASNWNLGGVYVFSSAVFPALARIPFSERGEKELTSAVSLLIDEGHEVRACKMHGFWSDIGTPTALREAESKKLDI